MLGLIDQFSRHMLGNQSKHQGPGTGAGDFLGDILFVVGEFMAQLPGNSIDGFLILHHFDAAENDHTADVQGPFTVLTEALVVHAEGGLVISFDGANFVAGPAAVEIQLAVLGAVIVIDGQSIGVAVVPLYAQDAAKLGLEQLNALFLG